jgi:hypothetical protein
MAVVAANNKAFTVKAYTGDNKTLLAFNFATATAAKNLAGFTIQCQPPGQPAYYLWNTLEFATPSAHSQIASEPPRSSANAPFQKFRWVHVPSSTPQGVAPATGSYIYVVTPRYFDASQSMQPLDKSLSISLTVPVGPFRKGSLSLGFTRGYMQSEAFLRHFGPKALLMPANKPLQFNTSQNAGTNPAAQAFTFADEYAWMGASARVQTMNVLNQVLNDPTLTLKMFAYDFNEPDVVTILLKLAAQGRARVILDNAALHTSKTKPTPEDQFTPLFNQQKKAPSDILRGHFLRYSHDKIFIVSKSGSAISVLTGSTNFSLTGLYVNANHVLVFDDPTVAQHYSNVFDESWNDNTSAPKFAATPLATQPFQPVAPGLPRMTITFSPHSAADASTILNGIVTRVKQETSATKGNVIFAVMQLTGGTNVVYDALNTIHQSQSLYSYGISDSPAGTSLYQPASKTGVLVTGKPSQVTLPPPFDQLPSPPGHEIHDKFVICGVNGSDPVVYCGSSNLALGGEQQNGDNLLAIHDADVATAFTIEALLLIDHYNFLDRYAKTKAKVAAGSTTAAPAKSAKTAPAAAPAKPAPAKKAPAKREAKPKPAASKAAAKKPAMPAPKKAPAKKAPAKRAPAKKTAAKKKTAARKSAARKPVARKTAAKRAPARRGAAARSR